MKKLILTVLIITSILAESSVVSTFAMNTGRGENYDLQSLIQKRSTENSKRRSKKRKIIMSKKRQNFVENEIQVPQITYMEEENKPYHKEICATDVTSYLRATGIFYFSNSSYKGILRSNNTIHWTFDAENSLLTLNGSGKLTAFDLSHIKKDVLNHSHHDLTKTKHIYIGNGFTSIDKFTFMDFNSLSSINVPQSVTQIEENAFARYNANSNFHIN